MMLMSAAQWNLRLEHEYEAMCHFPFNNLFSWKIAPGQRAPRVKAYIVTYYVKTAINEVGNIKPQNKTEVLITLSDSPDAAPTVKIIGGKVPYLPNIFTSGKFCLGTMWAAEPHIWMLVINIGRILALDSVRTNPGSPANSNAALDWNNKTTQLYKFRPRNNINFPHPVGY